MSFDLNEGGRERWRAELEGSGVRGSRGPVKAQMDASQFSWGRSWYKN